MATSKITMGALLLVFGMLLILGGIEVKEVDACPQFCYGDLNYMTCPSTGSMHLSPACNCCFAGPGCTLFFFDGTSQQC